MAERKILTPINVAQRPEASRPMPERSSAAATKAAALAKRSLVAAVKLSIESAAVAVVASHASTVGMRIPWNWWETLAMPV